MFLSKIELDLKSPSARQSLRNANDMHRNLQALFSSSREESGLLYRLYKAGSGMFVYMLSEAEPSAVTGNGITVVGSGNVDGYIDSFCDGQVYSFNLLAVPCKKVASEGSKNSRRRNLTNREEREQWLESKGKAGGFEILQLQMRNGESLFIRKKDNHFRLNSVMFSGILKITDGETFKMTYKKGVGPEKAYGMGMLFLR